MPIAPAGRAPIWPSRASTWRAGSPRAGGDARGELERGAARRVELRGVVELDDLRVVAGAEQLARRAA